MKNTTISCQIKDVKTLSGLRDETTNTFSKIKILIKASMLALKAHKPDDNTNSITIEKNSITYSSPKIEVFCLDQNVKADTKSFGINTMTATLPEETKKQSS